VAAGATILVAGNAIFGAPDPERATRDLRAAATAGVKV
jgi:pentose-5-phosphate-3-epimerase